MDPARGCGRQLRGLGWTTEVTYRAPPPLPDRFVAPDGTVLMSVSDLIAGKAGFQRADLMDYGSLYGMGSYFGEDYTAANLFVSPA
jgi:nitric oxide reductase subunit B